MAKGHIWVPVHAYAGRGLEQAREALHTQALMQTVTVHSPRKGVREFPPRYRCSGSSPSLQRLAFTDDRAIGEAADSNARMLEKSQVPGPRNGRGQAEAQNAEQMGKGMC